MNGIWTQLMELLEVHSPERHEMRPPATPTEIQNLEVSAGVIPPEIRDMLTTFNGGEVFVDAIAYFSFYAARSDHPVSEIDWPSNLVLQEVIRNIPAQFLARKGWPIGVFNWGDIVFIRAGTVSGCLEPATGKWTTVDLPIADWIDQLIHDGETYLADL